MSGKPRLEGAGGPPEPAAREQPARPAARPLAEPEGLAAEFYAHCAAGRLCFQRCTACGTWRHLPRWLCARCGSPAWSWAPSSGRGRIHSWTVTHQAPIPLFAPDVPYAVVIVELEEGVRMVSGLRELAPERLALELPVEVVFEPVSERMALPFFRPRTSGAAPGARAEEPGDALPTEAEVAARIEAKAQRAGEEIDAALARAVEALRGDLPVEIHHERRQGLVEEAVKRRIDGRIALERSEHAAAGLRVGEERWERTLAELGQEVDASMGAYQRSLAVALSLNRDDARVRGLLEDLVRKAEGLRIHLRVDAESQIDVVRQQARLAGSTTGEPGERGRRAAPEGRGGVSEPPASARGPSLLRRVVRILGRLAGRGPS